MMRHGTILALVVLTLMLAPAVGAHAAPPPPPSPSGETGAIPPRLSYVNGEASFWRPGAQDWAPAQLNTPLAPGDELYTGDSGSLELQVGPRAFVRASLDTQLGLVNQEPDFLQFKVTSGHVSLDLRGLNAPRAVEVDTPHGTFTIENSGYYRVDVSQDRTSFITRRGGRAAMTPAGGQPAAIAPSEEVVLEGAPTATAQSFVAPELEDWDRWNYTRTDQLVDAVSARYVSPEVYGVSDLDHYGNWRVVPTYGSVWVPDAVPTGWVPYSTGKWVWDPLYGWTWVDVAPWGWAPYHYGRWVFVDGFWAWAPGPIVVRPVYAPALVAFFGAPGIRVAIGGPAVSWVALSWGEPLVPWWGRAGFVGQPWWGGWGGPRVVNNVVVNRTTVVNVTNITVYKNVSVQHAVVAVPAEHFGRRPVAEARVADMDVHRLEPVHGRLQVRPDAASFVAASGAAVHPPAAVVSRQVVATRPPARRPVAPRAESEPASRPTAAAAPAVNVPAPRIVSTPRAVATAPTPPRPPFGPSSVERERRPLPPRFEPTQGAEVRAAGAPPTPGGATPVPSTPSARGGATPTPTAPPTRGGAAPALSTPPARGGAPAPSAGGERRPAVESTHAANRPLPGEPANRLSPHRAERPQPQRSESERSGEPGRREGRGEREGR